MSPKKSQLFLSSLDGSIDSLRHLAEDHLAEPVPDCPGWTISDLVGHVGSVFAMVDAIVSVRSLIFVKPGAEAVPPQDDSLMDWFLERSTRLRQTLASVDESQAVWTWSDNQSAAFYFRRMAHETAVHLCDVQRSLGLDVTMNRDIALDAIDELYEVMLPRSIRRQSQNLPAGNLHLHCTDGPGEWLINVIDGSLVFTHEHAKADVAWRGWATGLVLTGWGRNVIGIQVLGDQTISEQWQRLAP